MISIDVFQRMVQQACDELPEEIFRGLNGGVAISERALPHPQSRGDDLYIMGQYVNDSVLGSIVYMYYGSFVHFYPHLDEPALMPHVRQVLRHELLHHLETRAGERGLADWDDEQLAKYLSRYEDE